MAGIAETKQLVAGHAERIKAWNCDPKPLTWTKTAPSIITKVNRAQAALEAISTTDH